tara:strand:- start:2305 stop:3453 length:1149 start_codon:yes stop_codon:yes gene_type:complete
MSEPAAPAPAIAEPVIADPIAAIPEATPDLGDYSFEAALEASINQVSEPVVSEPVVAEAADPLVAEPAAVVADPLESLEAEVPEDWSPKAAAAFQRLKSEAKTYTTERETYIQRAKELEAKVTELEGVVGDDSVADMQKKIDGYEQHRLLTNLEGTNAYQEAVIKPLDAVFQSVKTLAESNNTSYDDLVNALSIADDAEQEERVAELLPTASDREKAIFYRLAAEVDPILQRRDELRDNASEAIKEAELVDEQRSAYDLAQKAGVRTNTTRNVVGRITEKLPFLSGFEGLDIESIQTKAADIDPSVVHPVDFAYQAVAGQLLPTLVREFVASQKVNEDLMAKLAAFDEAEPNLSGVIPTASTAASYGKDVGFASAIEKQLGH